MPDPSTAPLRDQGSAPDAGEDMAVAAALAVSRFGTLPAVSAARVLTGARLAQVPARSRTHFEGEHGQHLDLVVRGVVRVFVTGPDGRSLTVRYCRPGALIGALSLFADGAAVPAHIQALVPVELLRLAPEEVRRAALADPLVAEALLRELSDRVHRFIHEIPESMFSTVRQRLAKHLLDLASEGGAPSISPSGRRLPTSTGSALPLTVRVSQGDLAAAVGTVREVVARTLAELRAAGIIRTYRDHIDIVDPERLSQEQAWNLGH